MWHLIYLSVDTVETYFDSHVDLLQRKLQKHSDKLKMKAEEAFKIKDLKIKDLSGDLLAENLEREIKSFKVRVCTEIDDGWETRWAEALLHLGFNAYDILNCFLAVLKSRSYA